MTADSPKQAVSNAKAVTSYASGYCHKYVRDQCWRVPSLYASAIEAWNGARYKHPGDRTPPLGAPMFYRGGQYGHAVINVADNTSSMRSTDCTSTGRVSTVDIGWVESHWGYVYLGWTEDINGVRVIEPEESDDVLNSDDKKWIQQTVNDAIEAAWQKQQSNDRGRAANLNVAGNVRTIVREELANAGLPVK